MYKNRRNKLLDSIKHGSVTILFSGVAKNKTADQHFPFEVNRNFYYLTGLDEPKMALVLIKTSTNYYEIIFKEVRTPQQILWDGDVLSSEDVLNISKISEVKDIEQLSSFLQSITSSTRGNLYGKLDYLYLDLESNHLDSESYKFYHQVKEVHPQLQISNLHNEIAEFRMIKSEDEINLIKEALKINELGLNAIMKHLKPGLFEYQIQALYEYVLADNQTKPSFDTIAASGHNATILHYVNNNHQIQNNELMLLDLGVSFQKYASDISRTYPVNGKFSARQKEIYNIVLKANKETIKMLKPGVTWQQFNDFARNILSKGLIDLGIITDEKDITKYYYHSIGHFLGLDVHDVGNYQLPLSPGMVVTVEPGLYISEENIGIRIEDNILITETGNINLSESIIKEVDEIEKFMAKK